MRHTHRARARRWLAAPWAGLLLLARSRERVGQAAVALGGAAAVAAPLFHSAWRPATAPVSAAIAYVAASAAVEPLRAELEERFATRWGPWTLPQVLARLALVSAALLAALGLAAVAVAVAMGLLGPTAALTVAAAVPPGAVLLVACAATVASGPQPSETWLYSGDAGLVLLVAHYTLGAHLAAAVVGLPAAGGHAALTAGAPAVLVALAALAWAVGATAVLARWSRRRLAQFH